MKMSRVIT